MWGDGSIKPGENAFARQFEPDGDGYLHRKNLQGRGVRVSPEEYEQFIRTVERGYMITLFYSFIIFLLFTAIISVLLEIVYGRAEVMETALGLMIVVIFASRRYRKIWQGPDKMLEGREKVGLDRSARDAKALRIALMGWTPILYCAGFIVVASAGTLQDGFRPTARDWIWLAPLLALIVGGLAWWSGRVVQANRTVRESE